ncbi:MAG: hypothetical protein JWQ09_431 [Segetibacter sp.]|nr:hypothetical protein [Segetibacter sp.]
MVQYISYIILDAARMGDKIEEAKQKNTAHDSLYRGGSEESLSAVAPYIFSFTPNTDFSTWYMEKGWGGAWGVMVRSSCTFPELHKHFRKFLLVKTEEGEELYFRFYDPRVLRIFLPTCDKQQILEFFGPVDYFITEGEAKEEAIVFKQKNGELIEEKIPASKVFGEVAEDKTPETKETEKAVEIAQEGKRPPRRFIY